MIAVIGAGPAGLAAAAQAAAAGHAVTVLEAAPVVGGMAGSFEFAGVRVDHGSHRFHPAAPPEVRRLVDRLLGAELQRRERRGRIHLGDRWVAFPLRGADLLRRLPPRLAGRFALDALTAPLRRPGEDSFAEAIRAGLGPTALAEFYGPYARKLWGVDATELDGALARRRVTASSPGAIARRVLRARRPEGRGFLYPRGGFGTIVERLADDAVARGVRLRTGCRVERVVLGDDGVRLQLDDGTSLDAAMVWSTAPLTALAHRVDPAPPAGVVEAAQHLRHRGMLLVYVALDRPRYHETDAHYVPTPGVAASRISEPKNYRDDPSDPADRTVLCAEIPADAGDATWSMDDDDLGALLADDLARLGRPAFTPTAVHVRRLPRVYPVYLRGFEWPLSRIELWAATQPRLLTFGRQGLFTPDNTHHAIGMGLAAAAALHHDGSFDHAAWARARAGFHDFVVED